MDKRIRVGIAAVSIGLAALSGWGLWSQVRLLIDHYENKCDYVPCANAATLPFAFGSALVLVLGLVVLVAVISQRPTR